MGVTAPAGGIMGVLRQDVDRLRSSPRLRRSAALWLALGLALSEAFTIPLAVAAHAGVAALILIDAACWLVVGLGLLAGITLLRLPDGTELDRFGLPNGLTALRAWLSFPLILCATLPLPGSSGLYLWAVIGGGTGMLDFADGQIARRVGPVTALGKAFDPAMDVLFFAMAAVGNWLLGILPGWLATAILIRYLGPFLITPVVFLLGRRPELVATRWGRYNTFGIGFVLLVLLLVRLAGGPVNTVALAVGIPVLLPTFALHAVALVRRAREAPAGPGPDRGPEGRSLSGPAG
ncbi:MAG: CDP-alcohol phosphatidyltransferase family protein [Candidatus Dormibacteria bacterium]